MKSNKHFVLALALLALFGSLLAGCGSKDSGTDTSTAPGKASATDTSTPGKMGATGSTGVPGSSGSKQTD